MPFQHDADPALNAHDMSATGPASRARAGSVMVSLAGATAGFSSPMPLPVEPDAVATQDEVGSFFRMLDELTLHASREAIADMRSAVERLRPFSNALSAPLISATRRMLVGAPIDQAATELVRMLTYLYIDAGSRAGRFTRSGGTALLSLMACMDEQQHRLGTLTLELVTRVSHGDGLPDINLLSQINALDAEHVLVSGLFGMVSDAVGRQDDAVVEHVVRAVEEYQHSGATEALAAVKSQLAA